MFFKMLFKPIGVVRDVLAGTFGAFGVHPNYITLLAIPLAVFTAWLYYSGEIVYAGLMLLAVGACDLVDGALARDFKRGTPFGTVLDFSVDNYVDMIIMLGILTWFGRSGSFTMVLISAAALTGIVMMNYTRARAETIVEKCKVGFLERPERFGILIIGSLVSQLVVAVGILAVLSNIDAIRRLVYTNTLLKKAAIEEAEKNQE